MKKLLSLLLLAFTGNAFAIGETFLLKTTGTEYCNGNKPLHFTPKNSVPLYIRFDSAESISVFVNSVKQTPDLTASLNAAPIGVNTLSFDAFIYLDDDNHMQAIGTLKIDNIGNVKSLKGNFMRTGLISGCYSDGKIVGKRI